MEIWKWKKHDTQQIGNRLQENDMETWMREKEKNTGGLT